MSTLCEVHLVQLVVPKAETGSMYTWDAVIQRSW